MLDMGFEKEMNQCLALIKSKIPYKFKYPERPENYWSDSLKINFVSATMNRKIEMLG